MKKVNLVEQFKDHEISNNASFEQINTKLDTIIIQTTKHNGRLTKLEQRMYMFLGGLIVISMVVVPLFLNLIK